MANIRVYELGKELDVAPAELLKMLQSIGINGKVPSSSIPDTAARSLRQMVENRNNPQTVQEVAPPPPPPATKPAFQNFRSEEFRARRVETAPKVADVSSDHIEDFRE